MNWQHGATNRYQSLFTGLLLLELVVLTGPSSFFLVYSIPKSMHAFLFSAAFDIQGIGFNSETLAYCAYIVTITLAMFLFWVFAYRVAFYKPPVLKKIYYIGLVFWLVNLVIVSIIDNIGAKLASETDVLSAFVTDSIFFSHFKHLAPFVFVYLHFTLLFIMRKKRSMR